ncbi:hypothetical protein, partial [Pseudomonas gelidaquae]|uniref:hypothetical protein n=1 Tax=Pseudomonas sp. IB20 TaxID=1702250 RepID=UPI001C46654F
GDALLSAEMCVLRWHGNTLHQVLHLVLETAVLALAGVFKVGKTHLAHAWLGSGGEDLFQHI